MKLVQIHGSSPSSSSPQVSHISCSPISKSQIERQGANETTYRIKNKAHLTPAQLVDPSITSIRQQLLDAIEINQNQGDYIVPASDLANVDEELDDDYAGSASDSDFDPEEYKREKERRKREMESVNGGVA